MFLTDPNRRGVCIYFSDPEEGFCGLLIFFFAIDLVPGNGAAGDYPGMHRLS